MTRFHTRTLLITLSALIVLPGCLGSGPGLMTPDYAASLLNGPSSFVLSGTGTATLASGTYVFADSTGTISQTNNLVTIVLPDPAVPLQLLTPGYAFYDAMVSGSCSLQDLTSSIEGSQQNAISTQLYASGCSDQAVINVSLDTTQVVDAAGDSGTAQPTANYIVDDAPAVDTSGVATGNTAADGTGTTAPTGGNYVLASDNSLVATFSKPLTGGSLNATISGCTPVTSGQVTISSGAFVTGSSGTTVYWTLGNLGSVSAGSTCNINVAGITDGVGNPEDPADSNLNMKVTFQ